MPFSSRRRLVQNTMRGTAFPPFPPHSYANQNNTPPSFPDGPPSSAAGTAFSVSLTTIRRTPRHKEPLPAALPAPDILSAARPAARSPPGYPSLSAKVPRAGKDTCTPAETATAHRHAPQSDTSDSFPPKGNKASAFRTAAHAPAPIVHTGKRKAGTHSNKPPPMLPPAPLPSPSCNPHRHVPNIHTTVGVFSKFSDTVLSSSQFHSSYFTSCL